MSVAEVFRREFYLASCLKFSFTYELMLPFTFLFGIFLASISPHRLTVLTDFAWFFTNFFFLSAPLLIFIILTSSLLNRDAARHGRLANYTMLLFFSLCFTSSIAAATILSLSCYRGYSGEVGVPASMSQLFTIVLNGLLKPVPLSILVSIITAYFIAARSDLVRSSIIHLDKAVSRFFRMLVKLLPIVSACLGVALYYSLQRASYIAYIQALSITSGLHLLYISIMILMVYRCLKLHLKNLLSYAAKITLAGMSLPSSYILLPLHLKIFGDQFSIDKAVKDFVLTLGAALNRAGSIMGVIISIYITSLHLGFYTNPIRYVILAPLIAVIGFASPGIPGGTIFVTMPVILDILSVPDVVEFSLISVALFNGITIVTAATNNATTGYMALIVYHRIHRCKR